MESGTLLGVATESDGHLHLRVTAGGLRPDEAGHVAGVAALWFEKVAAINPAFKTAQIEGHLVAGAILNTLAPGQDLADVGAGPVQAPKN